MKNLIIDATDCTPSIYFDAQEHLLEIRGTSYPENTAAFYAPVFSWLDEYFANIEEGEITVNVEIVYFNSGSSKALLEFFDLLDDAAFRGMGVTVNWIYEQDDEDMREYGEEFVEDFRRIGFHFVKKIK
ncbi:hypothetical protein U14_02755 [Candidatus Moduliflexus flocculans]|uniref:SiaC family regulatory phosphoprotein domain-containing protein n=1 Tax=Candidatus Moduliflexus flocculans TaxID=1499966 RepID=A0A081BM94_9BACT|nr:hypothetical protein U14_02755 [Candidatus Moduliflexus flocculans]